ncbi:MAG: hypothetical protein ACRDNK_11805 [Solirubrobacteraceae bacterium]
MTTLRTEPAQGTTSDARIRAAFYIAGAITLISIAIVIATNVADWPPTPANTSLAVMVLAWLGAFEYRRNVVDCRHRLRAEINELERMLWNWDH